MGGDSNSTPPNPAGMGQFQLASLGGFGNPTQPPPNPPPTSTAPLPPGESINTGVTPVGQSNMPDTWQDTMGDFRSGNMQGIQEGIQDLQGKQGMTGTPGMPQGIPLSGLTPQDTFEGAGSGMTMGSGMGQGQATPFPPNLNTSIPGVSQLDPLVAAQQGALLGLNPTQGSLNSAGTANPTSNTQALGQGQSGQGKPGMTGTPPMFTGIGG
jgi:hypothetical protein